MFLEELFLDFAFSGFFAFWLLGFSAFWLLDFQTSWLSGVLASRRLGFFCLFALWLLWILARLWRRVVASVALAFRILASPVPPPAVPLLAFRLLSFSKHLGRNRARSSLMLCFLRNAVQAETRVYLQGSPKTNAIRHDGFSRFCSKLRFEGTLKKWKLDIGSILKLSQAISAKGRWPEARQTLMEMLAERVAPAAQQKTAQGARLGPKRM